MAAGMIALGVLATVATGGAGGAILTGLVISSAVVATATTVAVGAGSAFGTAQYTKKLEAQHILSGRHLSFSTDATEALAGVVRPARDDDPITTLSSHSHPSRPQPTPDIALTVR